MAHTHGWQQGEGGKGKAKDKIAEKTMFHGKEERDNLGRSWIEAPKEQRPAVEQAYLPKRWIHTWSGHTKGVNAIRSVLPSQVGAGEYEPRRSSQPVRAG